MLAKLSLRNLFRNKWRSLLTAGGVAVAVTILVCMNAMMGGMMAQMIRAATELETGQVQFQTEAYVEEAKIWYSFPAGEQLYERALAVEGVETVEPRVEFGGLAGTDKRSKVTRFVGVDAVRSAKIGRNVVKGGWLSREASASTGAREVVLGIDLANQIGVEVGDELVAFASAKDGSIGNELLKVVGIVEAGNNAIDQRTAFIRMDTAQFIAAMDGEIHKVMVHTTPQQARETAERLESVAEWWQQEQLAGATTFVDGEERPTGLVVRPWQELVPTLASYVKLSESSMWSIYLVLYFLAALGILNAQRMSALERHREFGVMQAIGMSPRRILAAVLVETTLLTLAGAIVGAAVGTLLNLYFAEYGLYLGVGSFDFLGTSMSTRVQFVVTVEGTLLPVAAILPVAVLCGLWPAIASARLNPAKAISKRD